VGEKKLKNQYVGTEERKSFPNRPWKILPVAFSLTLLAGCQNSTYSVEAGSSRYPAVAPVGTVLRVRLRQAVDTAQVHPGDRFHGSLASPVVVDGVVILDKGAPVEGEIVEPYQPNSRAEMSHLRSAKTRVLSLALDYCERAGRPIAVSATAATRIVNEEPAKGGDPAAAGEPIRLPADAIVGFTLREPISD